MAFPRQPPFIVVTLYTLAIGATGAALAYFLSLPVFILTGPAILVTLTSLLGIRLAVMNLIRDAAFLFLGIGIGAGIDASASAAFLRWPLAFLTLAVALIAMLVVCRAILTRFFGYDRRGAVLAASPGHLSYVLSLGTALNANVPQITVVQSVRLLALTLFVPFVALAFGVKIDGNIMSSGAPMPLLHLLALLCISLALGLILQKLKVPAALLLGGLIVSSIAHLTNITAGTLPPAIALPSFLVLGTLIGTRFSGVTFGLLKTSLLAGLVTTAIAVAFTILAAFPVATFLEMPLAHVIIAFAPGGLETMIAMGVALDANPGFVAACHVGRLFLLTLLVPLMLGRRAPSNA